jgi:hypothetical protein
MKTGKMLFFVLLSFILNLQVSLGQNSVEIISYTLPEVSYPDLLGLEPFAVNELVNQLTTVGAVQISGIPKFERARKEALEDAAECLMKQDDKFVGKRLMDDGSLRLTSAAASSDGLRGPMSNECGENAYKLRSIIDSVTRQVFLALDSSRDMESEMIMKPDYSTFSDLIAHGNHLEHLHAYFPPSSSRSNNNVNKDEKDTTAAVKTEDKQVSSSMTMDFHTDNGLMIAMTTGYYQSPAASNSVTGSSSSSSSSSSQNGLYMMLPDGKKVKAVMSDSSLILLVGEGGMNWFAPVLDGKPLRAVPHALIVDLPAAVPAAAEGLELGSSSRSWFGKMLLPPGNAYLTKEKMTYEQYHQLEISSLMNPSSSSYIPLACAGGSMNGYGDKMMVENVQCTLSDGQPGIYCWMQVKLDFFLLLCDSLSFFLSFFLSSFFSICFFVLSLFHLCVLCSVNHMLRYLVVVMHNVLLLEQPLSLMMVIVWDVV